MSKDLEKLIAAGGDPVHDEDGNLLYVRAVPKYTGTDLHPDQVEGYEPVFDRQSGQRRVLQAVTDEIDSDVYGPRNSIPALAVHFVHDPFTPEINAASSTEMAQRGLTLGHSNSAEAQVEALLDDLIGGGLVEQRDDGTYATTDAGRVELNN